MQTNNYLREQFLSTDKSLPSSKDAELSIVSIIFFDNSQMDNLTDILKPEMFYVTQWRNYYQAFVNLHNVGKPIDMILVGEEFKKMCIESQGLSEISKSLDGVHRLKSIDKYAKLIADKFKAREFIKKCSTSISCVLAEEEEIGVTIDRHEGEIFALRDDEIEKTYSNIAPEVEKFLTKIQENARSKDVVKLTGLSTGYRDLDEVTGGLQKAQLIVIAARPSMGKSSFGLNICQNVVDDEFFGKRVALFFSLEMSKEQIAHKQLSADSKIDSQRLKKGFLMRDEWGKVAESVGKIKGQKLIIDDSYNLTPMDVRAKARRVKAEEKQLDLIVVDYIGKMKGSKKKYERRDLEIGDISSELKALAKEMNIPVIALCQLNRDCEKRKPPRPIMPDLAESSKLDNDADLIAFIYREDYYYPDTTTNSGIAEIIIRKNREGPTGTVKLTWLNYCTRFENLANL